MCKQFSLSKYFWKYLLDVSVSMASLVLDDNLVILHFSVFILSTDFYSRQTHKMYCV